MYVMEKFRYCVANNSCEGALGIQLCCTAGLREHIIHYTVGAKCKT